MIFILSVCIFNESMKCFLLSLFKMKRGLVAQLVFAVKIKLLHFLFGVSDIYKHFLSNFNIEHNNHHVAMLSLHGISG